MMEPECPFRAVMMRNIRKVQALLWSPEAESLAEPAVLIRTWVDPPDVELIERMTYVAAVANARHEGEPTATCMPQPDEALIVVSIGEECRRFHIQPEARWRLWMPGAANFTPEQAAEIDARFRERYSST
jgi:hypothetical protein